MVSWVPSGTSGPRYWRSPKSAKKTTTSLLLLMVKPRESEAFDQHHPGLEGEGVLQGGFGRGGLAHQADAGSQALQEAPVGVAGQGIVLHKEDGGGQAGGHNGH